MMEEYAKPNVLCFVFKYLLVAALIIENHSLILFYPAISAVALTD